MPKRVRVSPDQLPWATVLYRANFVILPVADGELRGTRHELPDVIIEVDPTAPMGILEEVVS